MPRPLFILVLPMLAAAIGCSENDRAPVGGGGSDGGAGVDAGPRGGSDGGPGADAGDGSDAGDGADTGVDGAGDGGGTGVCPPSAPFGTETGDVAPDVTLLDCDGVEHSLHELCEREVSWVFEFTDWCPPCRAFADRADEVYAAYEGEDLGAWFVISENDSFGPPTAELCAEIRDRYGLPMTVLYDPEQRFSDVLDAPTNDFHLVMKRGNVIEWTGHYADSRIEDQLDAAFAR